VVTLNIHKNERGDNIRSARRESSSSTARVNEEFAVLFVALISMCMTCDQNIAVKLPLKSGKSILISPRNDVVTMAETNAELLNWNDLSFRPGLRA